MSTQRKIREKKWQSREVPTFNNEIVVYNDDVNTHLIMSSNLNQSVRAHWKQAEQCSLISITMEKMQN
jgi:hypothetical protein